MRETVFILRTYILKNSWGEGLTLKGFRKKAPYAHVHTHAYIHTHKYILVCTHKQKYIKNW